MLIEVNDSNLAILYEYIKKGKERNIYFFSDIEAFGLHNDFQKVWYLEENGVITAAFLKYYDNFLIYSQKQDYDRAYAEKLIEDNGIKNTNMSYEDYMYLKDFFASSLIHICTMCAMDKEIIDVDSSDIKRATIEDARKIVASISTIEEFASFSSGDKEDMIARKVRGIKTDFQRTFYIEKDGEIISHAATSCMSNDAAILAGVFTLKEYRNQGYAKRVVGTLCNSLISENKTPLLYFNNPIAGEMYHKLGFKDVDHWVIIHYIKN